MGRLVGGQPFPFMFEGLPPYPDDGMVKSLEGEPKHLNDVWKFDWFWVGTELVWLVGSDPMNEQHIVRHFEMDDHPLRKWSQDESLRTEAYHEGRRSGLRSTRGW